MMRTNGRIVQSSFDIPLNLLCQNVGGDEALQELRRDFGGVHVVEEVVPADDRPFELNGNYAEPAKLCVNFRNKQLIGMYALLLLHLDLRAAKATARNNAFAVQLHRHKSVFLGVVDDEAVAS